MEPALDEIFESPSRDFSFACCNWHRRRSAELVVALQVILGEWFFEPPDIELLKQSGALQRLWDFKRQPGVNHDVTRAGGPPRGLHVRHILSDILAEWSPPEFHCRETQINCLTRQLPSYLGSRAEQITGIRADGGAAALSQQLVDRLSQRFAAQ